MMRTQCFVFCHGFGFDASFWNSLRPYFSGREAIYLDLEYFDAPVAGRRELNGQQTMDSFTLLTKTSLHDQPIEYIGIGHSLGLMKLMSLSLPFNCLIGLHGFVNFLGFNASLHRRRSRELHYLTRQFTTLPELTLSEFYQRTGVQCKASGLYSLNRIKLLGDLVSLTHSVPVPDEIPMLILGSNDDKITPPALLEDNFGACRNVTLEILSHAQHGLGYLNPDLVYQKIMSFVTSR